MKSSGLNKSGISPAHVRKQRNSKSRPESFPVCDNIEALSSIISIKITLCFLLHSIDTPISFFHTSRAHISLPFFYPSSCSWPLGRPRKEPIEHRLELRGDADQLVSVPATKPEWSEYLQRHRRGLERSRQCSGQAVSRLKCTISLRSRVKRGTLDALDFPKGSLSVDCKPATDC